jgi:hypothetical protein
LPCFHHPSCCVFSIVRYIKLQFQIQWKPWLPNQWERNVSNFLFRYFCQTLKLQQTFGSRYYTSIGILNYSFRLRCYNIRELSKTINLKIRYQTCTPFTQTDFYWVFHRTNTVYKLNWCWKTSAVRHKQASE